MDFHKMFRIYLPQGDREMIWFWEVFGNNCQLGKLCGYFTGADFTNKLKLSQLSLCVRFQPQNRLKSVSESAPGLTDLYLIRFWELTGKTVVYGKVFNIEMQAGVTVCCEWLFFTLRQKSNLQPCAIFFKNFSSISIELMRTEKC